MNIWLATQHVRYADKRFRGISLTFGAFQSFYTNASAPLGTPSQVSWIGSIQSFSLLFLGIFSGPVFDNGYGRSLVVTGSLLCFLGLFLASFAGQVYWRIVLSQGVLTGLGMGLTFVPAISVPTTYFSKHRALATGLALSGSSAGGIAYPPLIRYLLATVGFSWTMRIFSFITAGMLAVACLLMRQRFEVLPPPERRRKISKLFNLSHVVTMPFAILAVGIFLAFFGLYAPYFYIQNFALDININMRGLSGAWLVSFLNVGGIIGRVLPALLADKIGAILVHATCALISGVLIFIWPTALSLPKLITFALFYGFFSGAVISLPPSSVGSLSKDLGQLGQRLGLIFTINSFAFLSGTPITGAILERYLPRHHARSVEDGGSAIWAYQVAAIACGLFTAVGGLVIYLAGFLNKRIIR